MEKPQGSQSTQSRDGNFTTHLDGMDVWNVISDGLAQGCSNSIANALISGAKLLNHICICIIYDKDIMVFIKISIKWCTLFSNYGMSNFVKRTTKKRQAHSLGWDIGVLYMFAWWWNILVTAVVYSV